MARRSQPRLRAARRPGIDRPDDPAAPGGRLGARLPHAHAPRPDHGRRGRLRREVLGHGSCSSADSASASTSSAIPAVGSMLVSCGPCAPPGTWEQQRRRPASHAARSASRWRESSSTPGTVPATLPRSSPRPALRSPSGRDEQRRGARALRDRTCSTLALAPDTHRRTPAHRCCSGRSSGCSPCPRAAAAGSSARSRRSPSRSTA